MSGYKFSANKNNTTGTSTSLFVDYFNAYVFDLDGVITQTAKVHAAAWKQMFDEYLSKHSLQFEPFDIENDYQQYVDGKPRYNGVYSFLKSRNTQLPYGKADDPSDQETVCGLGNRKNQLFLEKLRTDGVELYESTITLIQNLRHLGLRIAVVSSSCNCQEVLESAGITALFDARVDGVELQRLKLAGKPSPDMFLEASRRLDSKPRRTVGFEDAIAGVQALRAADFGYVIGVDRGDKKQTMLEHGADIVVTDLNEMHIVTAREKTLPASQLPSALDKLNEITLDHAREPALFLDYDGTLTPIVPHPDDAILGDTMRTVLQQLATLCNVAVISGRDLDDVRERVGIKDIWYAGSHGFDIAGPAGEHNEYQEGCEYLPSLDSAEKSLRDKLSAIPGCLVERKRFSISTHYRKVSQNMVDTVKQVVDQIHDSNPELRLTTGKMILELQPDIDWNKGKALHWLMQVLDINPACSIPIYIGDDVTDEDAFEEVSSYGAGILVTQGNQPTHATFSLIDPTEVEKFLNHLYTKLAMLN